MLRGLILWAEVGREMLMALSRVEFSTVQQSLRAHTHVCGVHTDMWRRCNRKEVSGAEEAKERANTMTIF